jgi:hypothetical protein
VDLEFSLGLGDGEGGRKVLCSLVYAAEEVMVIAVAFVMDFFEVEAVCCCC